MKNKKIFKGLKLSFLFAILISLVTLFTIAVPKASATYSGAGAGNQSDPYIIGTKAELFSFRDEVNAGNTGIYGVLTKDIELTSEDNWEPIGSAANKYVGTFDGQGHTITANITGNKANYGLFGYIGTDGIVSNILLKGKITNTAESTGGIAGINEGKIQDCGNYATVEIKNSEGIVGGIAGQNLGGSILRCYSRDFDGLEPYSYVDADNRSGGIAGYCNGGLIENCYVSDRYYVHADMDCVGGIVGLLYGGTVKNCFNYQWNHGNVEYMGSIVGDYNVSGGTIEGCYYQSSIKGIGGYPNSSDLEGKTISLSVLNFSTVESFVDWDFTNTWAMGLEHPLLKKGRHEHNSFKFDRPLTSVDFNKEQNLKSGNYYLSEDIIVSQKDPSINIDGENVNICLNGHCIKSTAEDNSDEPLFDVYNNSTLSIYDCCSDIDHSFVIVDKVGKVDDSLTENFETFTGGYITGFKRPIVCAKGNSGNSTFNMYGGTIIGNCLTNSSCGLIHAYGGAVNLHKANIFGNYSINSLPTISILSGDASGELGSLTIHKEKYGMTRVFIYYNYCSGEVNGVGAGAIYIDDSSSCNINGGEFVCNESLDSYGGVIHCKGDLTISEGALFKQNVSKKEGGAIYIDRSSTSKATKEISITADIRYNKSIAGIGGGGIYFANGLYLGRYDTSKVNNLVLDSLFFFNEVELTESETYGGGVYIYDYSGGVSTIEITNSIFRMNKLASDKSYGGAIAYRTVNSDTTSSRGLLRIDKSQFNGNTAAYGGALYMYGDNVKGEVAYTINSEIKSTSFTENSASKVGGAIYIDSKANTEYAGGSFEGGTIIQNNTAGELAGGVYFANTYSYITGLVKINNNKGKDNIESNFYLNKPSTPNTEEALKTGKGLYGSFVVPSDLVEESLIGISMEEACDFSVRLSKDTAEANDDYFLSDDSAYIVKINETTEQLMLASLHTHNWGYTADSNKITASCSEDGCPVTEGLTLEMVAPTNLTYDGTAKAVTLKEGYSTAAFANPTIKYFKDNDEVTECVNAGEYTAKITYGNAVAVLTFEIVKANPTPTEVTDKNATYNQTLSEITLPDGWAWNSSTDKVGNVGTRVHKATFTPEDTQNFNTVEQDINVIVAKANPEYTVPTGLKALINKTLADVTLPTGWAWDDNTLNVGNEPGNKTYKATFTPEDTDNYNLAEHIDVTVLVSLHEHNFTYTANGNKITATCTSADCPIIEGLTLTMVAPTELTYSATAKVVTLQTGYNTEAFPNATIKYYKGTTEVTECVNAGEYTAKVTFGNATASVTITILNWTIPVVDKGVTVEIEGAPKDTTVEVEVEVKTDISSEEAKSDYKDAVSKKLEENQKIAFVYDVKLIQKTIVGGVETKKEIQPSDIKPGTTIVIKMDIPTVLQGKEFKLLHIHSANDIEYVNNFEVSKDGKTLTVKVNKLSEFAFVETVVLPAKSHGFCIGYVALILAILLLIYTVFYVLLYFNLFAFLSKLRKSLPLINLISIICASIIFIFGLIALIVHTCPVSIASFIMIAVEFGLILILFILYMLHKNKDSNEKKDEAKK